MESRFDVARGCRIYASLVWSVVNILRVFSLHRRSPFPLPLLLNHLMSRSGVGRKEMTESLVHVYLDGFLCEAIRYCLALITAVGRDPT